ncbi:MAG: sigma-54-dependent Fis family transcriptional regulator, partial [Gammaproteobacteria bacterium]|nr:sigma-54-dependent Fis family transcriptional regulator [Gammaproteobacteria bacterium]
MTVSNKILLIDDDEQSRHDLEVVTTFLGEATVTANSDNWCSTAAHANSYPGEICVSIIGDCQHVPLAELLIKLYDWDPGMPLVILGQNKLSAIPDQDVLNNIIVELSFPLRYQSLLDAIHQAKVFRDHFNRLRNLGGVRDYNMFRSLVGNSNEIQRVRQMMGQVADKEVTVLITGESGTGKEVVARNLHLNSSRADKSFVPINCGAIPQELLESELFGHEKGAFTGAIS